MNEEQFLIIREKLDNVIKLLALNYVKEIKIQKNKILLLNSLGYSPSEIASFLDTTPNTVSVTLSKEKKK